jgi:cysteine synthase
MVQQGPRYPGGYLCRHYFTSGGTFAGALKIAAEAEKGANILCMLPDTGERYLSTPLFAGDGSKDKLILGASRPTQSKPTELQDAL